MKKFGFTLFELLITLAIMGIVLALGIFTMNKYMPRHRLADDADTTAQFLARAQSEATARTTWACVQFDPATRTLSVHMDTNHNYLCDDPVIVTRILRDNTGYVDCEGTGGVHSFDFSVPIWFDLDGVPRRCDNLGDCSPETFQIIIANTVDLAPEVGAREIEALSSGIIEVVERGKGGFLDSIFARTTARTSLGACPTN